MIPESELQRIKDKAEHYASGLGFDPIFSLAVLTGYIAGATSEYERAQARIDELENEIKDQRELLRQYNERLWSK